MRLFRHSFLKSLNQFINTNYSSINIKTMTTQTLFPAQQNGKQTTPKPLNDDEPVGFIYCTRNYSKFTRIKGNRTVDTRHLKHLLKAMQERFLMSPIIVNEKFEIIDGQHRFENSKTLTKPIYYIIAEGYGLNEVQILNTNNRPYTVEDSMNGYIDLGLKDYELYKLFREETGFDHRSCLMMLNGGSGGSKTSFNLHQLFRLGKFVIKDFKGAQVSAEKINMVGQYYKGYKRRNFVLAMLRCFRNEDYNHSFWLNKLSYQSTRMVDCVDTSDYMTLIEDIYNYKNRENRINLRFSNAFDENE